MKNLLIVVDYQNDFVDGALGFPGAQTLDAPIAERIKLRRSQGYDILFTLDTHEETYLDTQEGKRLPVRHCIRGDRGHELYGEVAKELRPEDTCIKKAALGSGDLLTYLMKRPYDQIELVGLVSNMCVISNAVVCKAALPEANVSVCARLTKSFDPELHEKSLDVMQGLHIDITERD
ncbi:MAG: isochorismatase family cysteine hydrolase [Bacillota bacterium]